MPGCDYCARFYPTFVKLANELHGKFTFSKYNITKNQKFGAKYNISRAPTLIIFRDTDKFKILHERDESYIRNELVSFMKRINSHTI